MLNTIWIDHHNCFRTHNTQKSEMDGNGKRIIIIVQSVNRETDEGWYCICITIQSDCAQRCCGLNAAWIFTAVIIDDVTSSHVVTTPEFRPISTPCATTSLALWLLLQLQKCSLKTSPRMARFDP